MITYFGKNRCKKYWHKLGASDEHREQDAESKSLTFQPVLK